MHESRSLNDRRVKYAIDDNVRVKKGSFRVQKYVNLEDIMSWGQPLKILIIRER